MSKLTTTPATNPFKDCQSVTLDHQIMIQIESILDICDNGIHFKTPQTPAEVHAILWRLRLLSESTLLKFKHLSDIEPMS